MSIVCVSVVNNVSCYILHSHNRMTIAPKMSIYILHQEYIIIRRCCLEWNTRYHWKYPCSHMSTFPDKLSEVKCRMWVTVCTTRAGQSHFENIYLFWYETESTAFTQTFKYTSLDKKCTQSNFSFPFIGTSRCKKIYFKVNFKFHLKKLI
jgi:hypothetical protein